MNISIISQKAIQQTFAVVAVSMVFGSFSYALALDTEPTPTVPEVVTGCMDDSANNFNPNATASDGSCTYTQAVVPTGECEIEGHKYDEVGTPLSEWVIGLMKVITRNEGETTDYHDLVNDLTDEDGYYCLEWDGYEGTEDIALEQTDSFIYRVYEILKDGWENVSVEMGPDGQSLTVVSDEAIYVDDLTDGETVQKYVSIDVSEVNGYIYADTAYHVDFYNTNTNDGGGGDADIYKIFGYIWHDANSNDVQEQDNLETEGIDESESDLQDWEVKITNGVGTFSTVSDVNGYYEFFVPAGTWTITETLQSEWSPTFPNDNQYVVTVPVPVVTLDENINVFAMVMDYIVPTAQAVVLGEVGPRNFGNVFIGSSNGNNGGNGGGGSSSGSRKKKSSNDDGGQGGGGGEVLGASTSAVPVGAPNTGAGGTSPVMPVLPTLTAILSTGMSVRKGA